MMTPPQNPYNRTLNDCERLLATIDEHCIQLEMALENRHFAQLAHQTAKQDYELAEAEFLAALVVDPAGPLAGVAQTSKAYGHILAGELAKAKAIGDLSEHWRTLSSTKLALDNAELGFTQCQLRHKSSCVAADLRSGMLRAASV